MDNEERENAIREYLEKVSTKELLNELCKRHGEYNSNLPMRVYEQEGEEDFDCWIESIDYYERIKQQAENGEI